MMGQQTGGEARLFYAFNLDEYVPEHHILRRIDRALDLSKLRHHLADFYSHTGRPSVDPKKVSLTDPLARWTAATGPAFYAYSTNYLADMACGIIVDVEATHAHRISEVESTKVMVDRVEEQFGLKPERLIGDSVYGTAPMLSWLVDDKGIEPHIPVWDKSVRTDGTFSRSDFQWDEAEDEYRCPGGKALRSRQRHRGYKPGTVTRANTIIYRASELDCRSCALKQHCCPNEPRRKIARSVHEAARDVARRIAKTPEYQRSYYQRRKVEMLFAHLKCILKVDRLRLRGLTGAKDEFLLAATAQNLRKLAKLMAQPPPIDRIGAPA
ncbi:MAG: transposase [Gammaproteobacteria bacterium]|nr:transposase [Gammaproteobacteria bacterium]